MPDLLDRLKTALSDRYAIQEEIGAGGMATVYLAEDLKHHRHVAVKVLRPELAATLGPERFVREIEIAAQLTHPHILPLHDSGEAEGFLYYVMPFIEGQSLRQRLVAEGTLSIPETVRVLKEVTDALTASVRITTMGCGEREGRRLHVSQGSLSRTILFELMPPDWWAHGAYA